MNQTPYTQVPPDDASARSLFFLASELDPSPEAAVRWAIDKRRRLLEEGMVFPAFGAVRSEGAAMGMQETWCPGGGGGGGDFDWGEPGDSEIPDGGEGGGEIPLGPVDEVDWGLLWLPLPFLPFFPVPVPVPLIGPFASWPIPGPYPFGISPLGDVSSTGALTTHA